LATQNNYSTEKPKNRNSKVIKILLGVLGFLVVGTAISIFFLVDIFTNDDPSSLFEETSLYIVPEKEEPPVTQTTAKPEENNVSVISTPEPIDPNAIQYNDSIYIKNENIVNLLFLGIDTNTERRVGMAGYRSDVVMVCAIDVETRKATLISIPRDTRTTVQKVDEDTGVVTELVEWKINTVYSYGGGIKKFSSQNAIACVQMFLERNITLEDSLDFQLDIPVYLYASMDMDGIPHVASSVGGVV